MSDATGIEWTDATWNPVRGCTRVSPGCENCYAERVAARFSGPGQPYEGLAVMGANGPRWTREVALIADKLDQPLRWKKPRRIFVNSMSDLFHEGLSDEAIMAVFGVMAAAPQHTFQVLTKRAARMRRWFEHLQDDTAGPGHGPARAKRVRRHVDWVIAGAESGPGARSMNEDWVRSVRDQCASAGVTFFFKQAIRDGNKVALPLLDGARHTAFPAGRGAA